MARTTTVTVGSIIRATRPNLHAKFSSKAIIATVNYDDIPENNSTSQTSVCLIWEPIDPKPIQSSKIEQRFLVCPMPGKTINEITSQENANDGDEEEAEYGEGEKEAEGDELGSAQVQSILQYFCPLRGKNQKTVETPIWLPC